MLDNRFWSKVDKTNTCWNWTAAKNKKGYGQFWINKKQDLSHRVSYEEINGKIPQGLQIDHLCRNPSCVNPHHLETVTQKENILRGISFSAQNSKKTHCSEGHEYSKKNTYVYHNGWRQCKICNLTRNRQWYHRKKMTGEKLN